VNIVQPDIPTEVVSSGRLTHYGLKFGTWVENRKKLPLNFRPPNPEIIMVDPQRKCYGLKNFCRSNTLPGITFIGTSQKKL
jgi:hypothetical protein